MDTSLTDTQMRVLMVLATFSDRDNKSFPKQTTIAEACNMVRETVNRALKVLAGKGYVRVVQRWREDGSQMSNAYTVLLDSDVTLESQGCDAGITGGVTPGDHTGCDRKGSHQEDTQLNTPNEAQRVREVFEFYNQTAERVGWVVHSKLTDALRKPLNARIEDYGADRVKQFIEALTELEWTYRGFRDKPDFRASLTYITRPRTFAEHFDKLVTSKPKPDLLSGVDEVDRQWPLDLEGAFNALERELINGATRPDWIGGRYGYPIDPRCPDAEYPAGLYALFPKIQKRDAVS
tara:strand:+ start:939 stop:1814 length:876 start_codon:yes stop_codon:yes gene_type:complete